MGRAFVNYRVEERSFVSYVKREIHMEVTKAHFSEKQVAAIDIIVSELTSNLIKHAGSGEVLYRTTDSTEGGAVFEVICIDNGPGMSDPERMMVDGVSTSGTLGQGLGAIGRLSTESQVYSMHGVGTIVYSRVGSKPRIDKSAKSFHVDVKALCVSKPRESVCGDGFEVVNQHNATKVFFGDGLGHGEHAKAAVDSARIFFSECDDTDPVNIIKAMHEKVRRTRGLVGVIAVFDKTTSLLKLCGVGNVAVRLFTGLQLKNYMSYNGTVGLNMPNSLKESVFPIEKNQHLIMCTDGIQSRWNLSHYPSIFKFDNTILAAALYRDYSRGTDDASVLIAKVS